MAEFNAEQAQVRIRQRNGVFEGQWTHQNTWWPWPTDEPWRSMLSTARGVRGFDEKAASREDGVALILVVKRAKEVV